MQKIVVLGATSGIAQATQRLFAQNGKEMLLVARSPERLSVLRSDLLVRGAKAVHTLATDFNEISWHPAVVQSAEETLPGFDTVLLAFGSLLDPEQSAHSVELSLQEWNTNFLNAAALLTLFANHFEARRTGCIAAITSVAGDRGRRSNYVYGSAKGALSIFLQGLRSRLYPAGVRVITIKPGPVDTPMTAHMQKGLTFSKPERVARDICRALERGSPDVLYTPGYWRYIMAAIRLLPERIFKRLSL
jgi:decaprenylphospho-beta-D-erythro-pentofuranosid-2-ulose 2-reductase